MVNENLLQEIRTKLISRGETVAVAESVTAGLLQNAFSQAKDASCFFQGGITAYNLGQKAKHLGVDPILASACDCVSETVTRTMADEITTLFMSHWGIGITGYATRTGKADALFAIYHISYKGEAKSSGHIGSGENEGFDTQSFFVNHILEKFNAVL